MTPLKIAVIGNFTDRKCGFQNFSVQTAQALTNAGHDVTAYDGTYSQVYARREACQESFLPPDPLSFDVIHVVWHPATLNHYAGADWQGLRRDRVNGRPILSQWNGCPAASCPFTDFMDVRWGVLGREPNHRQLWYPIPDWVDDLPAPNADFTVGYSGVRGDGRGLLEEICTRRGWQMNFSGLDAWLPLDEEIRRLARSTVNVGWYGIVHDDRSGAAMVCLASRRPFLCNDVPMFTHLKPYAADFYDTEEIYMVPDLEEGLERIEMAHQMGRHLCTPSKTWEDLSWTAAVRKLEEGWLSV